MEEEFQTIRDQFPDRPAIRSHYIDHLWLTHHYSEALIEHEQGFSSFPQIVKAHVSLINC